MKNLFWALLIFILVFLFSFSLFTGIKNNYFSGDLKTSLLDSSRELNRTAVSTCSGDGTILLYSGDPFGSIDTSFEALDDQLLIFASADANLVVRENGQQKGLNKVFDSGRIIYAIDVKEGSQITVTGTADYGSRSVQGFMFQDKDDPVYDIESFQYVHNNEKSNQSYLIPGTYSFAFFDKYTRNKPTDSSDDQRPVNVSLADSSGTKVFSKIYNEPYAIGYAGADHIQGGVIDTFEISEAGNYTFTVGDNKGITDSVYWAMTQCAYCGDGVKEDTEQCDDGNNNSGDGCSESCLIEEPGKCGPDDQKVIDYLDGPSAEKLCESGNASEVSFVETSQNPPRAEWRWVCAGENVDQSEQCKAYVGPLDGACGPKNGQYLKETPSSELCAYGDATEVVGQDSWTWTCKGKYGGNDADCEAYKENTCGDGKMLEDETCDLGASNGQVCAPGYGEVCEYCSEVCEKMSLKGPYCGDGVVQGQYEECDLAEKNGQACTPGYEENCQSCSVECKLVNNGGPYCGDGVVNDKEQCDDGSKNGKKCSAEYGSTCEYCAADCTKKTLEGGNCGDGKVDAGEECDDGNNKNGDGCSAVCDKEKTNSYCGDGKVDAGEECDDGNNKNGDGCDDKCDEEYDEPGDDDCKGSIGNYVWWDKNGDGVQDEDEPGLADVDMKLIWAGENGEFNTGDDEKYKTETNSKGRYEFDDLCAGKYKVYVDEEDVEELLGKEYYQTYDPDEEMDGEDKVELTSDNDEHTKSDFGYNVQKIAPSTGFGTQTMVVLLGISALITAGILLLVRRFKRL